MNSELANRLREKYYKTDDHPYRLFERRVESLIGPQTGVLLDAGCGRSAPVLRKFNGKVARLIGIEMVPFIDVPEYVEIHNADLANIPLPSQSVDIIMSRSVFEHLVNPELVYAELARILKPGGMIVFLTASFWDYGTQVARLVPNRYHAGVVRRVEGRKEEDTFPTAYKTNTRKDVAFLAGQVGLEISDFQYLSQYPNYLMFNGVLFALGMVYERIVSRFEILRSLRGWILVTLRKPT